MKSKNRYLYYKIILDSCSGILFKNKHYAAENCSYVCDAINGQ